MKHLKIGIIVTAFGFAGLITLLGGESEEERLDAAEGNTLWKCASCGSQSELTARVALRSRQSAKGVPIICPQCEKKKAYPLTACLRCRTLMFGSEVPGHDGRCPKCPTTTQPAEKPSSSDEKAKKPKKPANRVVPKSA